MAILLAALLALAPIAKGEAPPSLVGVEGYTLALCTMANRLEAGATVQQVRRRYYARPRALTDADIDIVHDVASGEVDCPPVYYLMSQQDIERHGWQPGKWQGKAYTTKRGTVYQVHGFERWPE